MTKSMLRFLRISFPGDPTSQREHAVSFTRRKRTAGDIGSRLINYSWTSRNYKACSVLGSKWTPISFPIDSARFCDEPL